MRFFFVFRPRSKTRQEERKAKKVGSFFFFSLFYLKRLSVRNRKSKMTNLPMTKSTLLLKRHGNVTSPPLLL